MKYVFETFIMAGEPYLFDSGGVDRFRIVGIEASVGLDPNNATAFPTALTFVSDGSFTGTMTPMVPNQVEIDIKPGSDPNCINSDGHGVIPVAILSSADFDATQVDPTTVSLDSQKVRVVGKGNTQAHIEDVNGDGLDDLIAQIEDLDGTYQAGDISATLTAATFDGTAIVGTDTLCIVP